MDASKVLHHAHALMTLGMSRAAEELLILLDGAVNEDQHYRDGIEDALLTLIKHGATDPRAERFQGERCEHGYHRTEAYCPTCDLDREGKCGPYCKHDHRASATDPR